MTFQVCDPLGVVCGGRKPVLSLSTTGARRKFTSRGGLRRCSGQPQVLVILALHRTRRFGVAKNTSTKDYNQLPQSLQATLGSCLRFGGGVAIPWCLYHAFPKHDGGVLWAWSCPILSSSRISTPEAVVLREGTQGNFSSLPFRTCSRRL